MENVDLKTHALNILKMSKMSKQFLSEDADLDPTAFIITADDQLLQPIDLQDEASKIESCAKIVDEARRQKARAIITVFLARSKDFDSEGFAQDDYSWGDIQNDSLERSILLTLSGPGIKNWATAVPFRSADGKLSFGERVEYAEGVDLGLFPGWSEPITSPRAS
jgi:hypothetical protein